MNRVDEIRGTISFPDGVQETREKLILFLERSDRRELELTGDARAAWIARGGVVTTSVPARES